MNLTKSIFLVLLLLVLSGCNHFTVSQQQEATSAENAQSTIRYPLHAPLDCAEPLPRQETAASQHGDINILLPPCYSGEPLPVLYLLLDADAYDTFWRLDLARIHAAATVAGRIQPYIIASPPLLTAENGAAALAETVAVVTASYAVSWHGVAGVGSAAITAAELARQRDGMLVGVALISPEVDVGVQLAGVSAEILIHAANNDDAGIAAMQMSETLNKPHIATILPGRNNHRFWQLYMRDYLRWFDRAITNAQAADGCDPSHGSLERQLIGEPTDVVRHHVYVYLPPCYDSAEAYPLLYLLHGAGLDSASWSDLGVGQVADDLIAAGDIAPLVMVMPPTLAAEDDFDALFWQEVVPLVEKTYALDGQTAIGGMSVGGGLAMRVALENADKFDAMQLFSLTKVAGLADFEAVIGGVDSAEFPATFLDVGDRDGLRRFHEEIEAILDANSIPYTSERGRGMHTLPYWQSRLPNYLRWLDAQFD